MNTRITITLLSLAVVLQVSCSKSQVEKDRILAPGDFELTYSDFSSDMDSKQYASDLKYEVYWEASDAVAIYNATQGVLHRYVVKSGAGEKTAVFTPDGSAPSYGGSDELYVIFPYDAATLEGGTLYLSIYRNTEEDVYSSSTNKVFSRNDLMMSNKFTVESLTGDDVDGADLTLKRLVTMVTLTTTVSYSSFSSQSIQQIRLKCDGLAGRAIVILTNGVPSIAANSGTEDECVFLTSDTPKMAYKDYLARFIPMFPVNMSQASHGGFSFILENSEYAVGFHRALNFTMAANKNYNFFLSDGLFGGSPVANEASATSEFTWWWGVNTNGVIMNGNAGSFGEGPGVGSYGGDAGSFTNNPAVNMGGNNAGAFTEGSGD